MKKATSYFDVKLFLQFCLLLLLFIPSFCQAQEIIGFDDHDYSISRTMRSVNVDAKLAEGKNWCEYGISKAMGDYLNDKKREDVQKNRWMLGNRTWSCGWLETCKVTWDLTEKTMAHILARTKERQLQAMENQNKNIEAYNREAAAENKPLKRPAVSLPQLHGSTDTIYVQFIHVPLGAFSTLQIQECYTYFWKHDLEYEIGPLDEENEQQDDAYRAANGFGMGMYFNLQYHYPDVNQNYVVFTPEDKIFTDDIFFSFLSNELEVWKP